MKTSWLHDHKRDNLIIFCNGWGMDGKPFLPLKANEYDVIMINDYTSLEVEVDVEKLSNRYKELVLVCWSMGVLAGQQIFASVKNRFAKSIAINGTLCPIDDSFGIPVELFQETLLNFNETTRLKFYRRMCRGKDVLKRFLEHQPERDIDNQKEELAQLIERMDCLSAETSMYTDVIISDRDYIISSENQERFWAKSNVKNVEGVHFPFYSWKSWDEIVQIDLRSKKK